MFACLVKRNAPGVVFDEHRKSPPILPCMSDDAGKHTQQLLVPLKTTLQ